VNLSDLAAMGAAPRWALLALALPAPDEAWLSAFSAGFFALAERHGIELVGGDTVRSPLLTISITAVGEVPGGVTMYRGSARPGDDVWVSGELGGAALGLRHPEIAEAAARLHRPEPRVGLGERLRGIARAAIDVSDGFASDLGHILKRSGTCAVVYFEQLPRAAALSRFDTGLQRECVLAGGDDYELVFTADPGRRKDLEALSRELGLRLSLVGSIQKGAPKLHLFDANGGTMSVPAGFDHFR
jgi:thiamine-monophosphate kinase